MEACDKILGARPSFPSLPDENWLELVFFFIFGGGFSSNFIEGDA